MTSRLEREAEDNYEAENDASPVPGDQGDNSYIQEPRREIRSQVSIQSNQDYVEDPMQPPYSNSNEQLGMLFCIDIISE